jgi:IMP cyclohydrolase
MIDDFSKLKAMKYSGRGITIGMTTEGNSFIGYTLTGRSSSSQARKISL